MKQLVIVGRPNVGKSALFNRLAGRNISIVHDQPGVTRDRITAECRRGPYPIEVIDTGGIGASPDPEFALATREAADAGMASADVLLFVVDGQDGLTPVDLELADMLRAAEKPVLLVVNKIDEECHESLTSDFMRLGFSDWVPVSAAHGRNTARLVERVFEFLPETDEDPLQDEPSRIAIVGRPNVGKSSLVNAILEDQRTIVSDVAGTTRDTVDIAYEFQGRPYVLCDTAGIRPRRRHNTSVEVFSVMRSEKAIERADVCLLVIDVAQGVTAQDKKIAGLIQQAGKAVLIVANKWDLVKPGEPDREDLRERVEAIHHGLFFLPFAPVVMLSAKSRENLPRLFRAVEKVRQHASRRISTGEVNRILQHAIERQQPPMRGAQRLKLLYATQTTEGPEHPFATPRFLLFVNNPKLLSDAYRNYLSNCIRKTYEFPGLPILLKLRSRHTKEAVRKK